MKMTLEQAAEMRLASGIYSTGQASGVLGIDPLQVQRLIARGQLPADRNSMGYVVLRSNLERYVGAGSPDLQMPEINTQGWFAGLDYEFSLNTYLATMRSDAALAGLADVSDAQIVRQLQADRTITSVAFDVQPTAEMRAILAAPVVAIDPMTKKPKPSNGLPYGMVAMIDTLRGSAALAIFSATGERSPLVSNLAFLYESPERYAAIIDRAKADTIRRLSIAIDSTRIVDLDGTPRTIRVTRNIRFNTMVPSVDAMLSDAVQRAF